MLVPVPMLDTLGAVVAAAGRKNKLGIADGAVGLLVMTLEEVGAAAGAASSENSRMR